jgi:hypothetical protein
MKTDADYALSLSKLVLAEVSPAEIPLVDAIGPTLIAADGRQRKDGSLGMGIEAVALAVVVVPVCKAVVLWLFEQLTDQAAEQAGHWTRRLLDRLAGRREPDLNVREDELPPEAIRRIREIAYRRAVVAGVDEPRAGLIADAVAGAIAAPAT